MSQAAGLVLRPLQPEDEEAAVAASALLRVEGFEFLLDRDRADSFPEYLSMLERLRSGAPNQSDRVPGTLLAAVTDGQLAGRLSVRHELNHFLSCFGGHIGFAVLPTYRGRGYATAMLRAGLSLLAGCGVAAALLTCEESNLASRAVIERCGGLLEDRRRRPDGGLTRRYLLSTARTPLMR